MYDDYGRNDRKEANRWFGLGVVWWIVIFVICGLLTISVWAFRVGTSETKGQGDAQIQKNSANNWVNAQREFNRLYQEIQADDRKINDAWTASIANPDDAVLKTNYIGLKQHCNTLVGDYNTNARSFLTEDFRDADLPEQINMADSATDCKEDTK